MEKTIIGFFEQVYEKAPGSLSRETNIREELGGGSLPVVAVVANIEEEYDVSYPLPEAGKAKTIGDMIDKVKELCEE